MHINFQDTTTGGFDYELLRGISQQTMHGAELGECLATAAYIRDDDFESWTQEWSRLADRVEVEAQTALSKGHLLSAHQALLRAWNYYRMAEYMISHDDPRQTYNWQRSRACFQQAIPGFSTPVEILDIPL